MATGRLGTDQLRQHGRLWQNVRGQDLQISHTLSIQEFMICLWKFKNPKIISRFLIAHTKFLACCRSLGILLQHHVRT